MSIEAKRQYEKKQRKMKLDIEYNKLLDNAVGKVKDRYEKKKKTRWNRIERDFDRKTRKIVLLEKSKEKLKIATSPKAKAKLKERIEKVKKKDVSKKPNYKQLAFKYFQLYIRLFYADDNGMVWLMFEQKFVHYTKCNAWHMWGKQQNWHMAFLFDNCLPISSHTNRRQWEYVWDFWKDSLIEVIWQERYNKLLQIAGDTIAKNQLRDMDYYKWQYVDWKGKCEIIAQEKWFII